jgi:Ca2+-binding RTX toxin-like protein
MPTGTPNSDNLSGDNGNNIIQGNGGNDNVIGNNGNDRIYGNSGNDVVKGGAGNDFISGGAGNDWVAGGQGDDIVMGGTGNDIVSGGEGDDLLFGGQANGGVPLVAEKDILSGGSGRDKFFLWDAGSQRNFYEGFGDADYADIIDFKVADDQIILGAGEGYTFSMTGAHTQIFNNGDLVAIVRNSSITDVQSGIRYIQPTLTEA